MATASWYCATCDTHGGGPPCEITPTEHINIEHGGGFAVIETDGDFRDFQRRQDHRLGFDIDER